MNPPTLTTRTPTTVASSATLLAASGSLLLLLPACTAGLDEIDRHADEIIARHTADLGPDAHVDPYAPTNPDSLLREVDDSRSRQTRYEPPTLHPPFDTLKFKTADPQRDVAAILRNYTDIPADAKKYDLRETIQYATGHSREYLTAKEELLLAALRLLIQRHQFGPRFFDDVSASFGADAEDGDYDVAVNLINEFRATQRLRSGGELSARALVSATEQLRETVADNSGQSAGIILSADLPLLRGAGDVAQESLISSEREMVYATRTFERFRRQFLFEIATDYFDLVQSSAQIRNAERVLIGQRDLQRETEALYKAGRRPQFDQSEARQRVLNSENSLANQRDNFIFQLERFRIRLGMPPDTPFLVDEAGTFDLPIPDVDPIDSVRRGLLYRLDLQTQRDRVDDSRRSLANARNDLLPDLNLSASMEMITDPDLRRSGLQFDPDETNWNASITYGLPLDRENERIGLRQAVISLEQAERDLRQSEDQIAVSIRSAVRQIELAIFSLNLQDESIRLIEQRIRGLNLRKDRVTTRNFIDAYDDLTNALDQREAARRDLRVIILRYLLETEQFRVDANGQFLAPPGLESVPASTTQPQSAPLSMDDDATGDAASQPATAPSSTTQPAPDPQPPPPRNPTDSPL